MNDIAMNTIQLKKINKNKVYRFIYTQQQTCKLDITRALNMGLSTVNQNLKLLEEEVLIQKNGSFESTGGRKADAIEIVRTARISIGLAIRKEGIDLVALDLYGTPIASHSLTLLFAQNPTYFKAVNDALELFIADHQLCAILGVSIAMQGIISKDGERVDYGMILDNEGMLLSDFTAFIQYPCRMEHDSKAAANLELWHDETLENAIVFLLNRNMGGAIITNGIVQSGNHMCSGIIEHLPIGCEGTACYCGQQDCLETYCSGDALMNRASMPLQTFFKLLRDQQPDCIVLWENYLTTLAKAIRNLRIVIDGKVIISGYIASFFTEADRAFLLQALNTSSPFSLTTDDLIIRTHGHFTQAIGTALFAISHFVKQV